MLDRQTSIISIKSVRSQYRSHFKRLKSSLFRSDRIESNRIGKGIAN